MKRLDYLLFAMLVLLISSCGGESAKSTGTKFDPQAKESTMTDTERQAAIDAKRAELVEIDTTVVFGSGVKLVVMTPLPDNSLFVTEKMSNDLAMRMLSIASKNGVSGMGGNPNFVFLAGITGADKKLTGSAPQKTMITYNLTLYVGNVLTGDVFGSTSLKLVGVGNNENEAAANAAQDLKDSSEIQEMLYKSSEKILTYYNKHANQMKSEIEGLISSNQYEKAYSLLWSIPQEATVLYPWVVEQLPKVGEKIKLKDSAQNFAKLKTVIAANDSVFNPEAGAILAMIPTNSPEYAQAHSLYDAYVARLRQRADDKAIFDRVMAERQQNIAHEKEMLQIEMDANVAQSQAKQMSSAEMRRQISMEDAAGSPFKLLWRKAGYALNDFFSGS